MAHLLRAASILAILTLASIVLLPEVRAHGGTYRGPGSTIPPGAGPAGPATGGPRPGGGANPATGGDASGDLTAWQLWWGLNREPYLRLRIALAQGGALAATGGYGGTTTAAQRATDEQVRTRIVPALVAVLGNERHPDVSTGALLALAKCGPRLDPSARTTASNAIRPRLGDANHEVSETAALSLGILARTADVPLLGALLGDEPAGREALGRASVPARTRAFAAYALGVAAQRIELEDVRRFIAHRLITVLEAPAGASRDLHVAALIALGLVGLGPGAAGLDGDADVPPTASAAALYDFLAGWYADERRDAGVRAYAPVSLAHLALRAGEARRAACTALLGPTLETGSNDPPAVRQGAVQALGLVADGDGDAHDARARSLLKLAGSWGDRLSRRLAWIALARAGARAGTGGRDALGETRSHLLGLLARGSTPERPWLALALGVGERAAAERGQKTPEIVHESLLRAIREHTSPGEQGAFLLAFALADAPTASVVVNQRLAELVDRDARGHAAIALGIAEATASIEPLRRIVLESRYEPTILREAAIALGLLGDTSLTPELVKLLGESRGLAALASVATALGYVGDQRAVEPLLAIAAAQDRDASARAFAFVALGLLSDPLPLPWNTPIALDVGWWLAPATLLEPATGTGVLDLL